MDNHPIPQDVTGFQFKLIGNMTVKQFAYLASGIVLAWILLQLPVNLFLKLPFCVFSALLGAGLAFFPISGRPMDLMIGNYLKALFRPTQFVYGKIGEQTYSPNKTPMTSAKTVKQHENDLNLFPKDKLKTYLESFNTANNVPHSPRPSQALFPSMTAPHLVFAKSQSLAPRIPDSPNLITGIIKDARGNALPNILIEIKDKDGNPIRAFKTNEVGRFASATPLANGIYTIELEDPKAQNKFEKLTINAVGQIITPIESTSIDPREELRRSLFNTN